MGRWGGWARSGWLSAALGLLLYARLGQICRNMEGLAARFAAGRLRRREVPAVRRAVEAGARVRRRSGERLWPGDFGWLVKAAAWHAAGFGCQLRAVLETPEMVALLKASPQAVRILTPLCRMLAIETQLLRPGVVPVVKVPVVTAKRVRRKRAPVDWGRIPIPCGVMAAVRRLGVETG